MAVRRKGLLLSRLVNAGLLVSGLVDLKRTPGFDWQLDGGLVAGTQLVVSGNQLADLRMSLKR